jgi:hypothetical protein
MMAGLAVVARYAVRWGASAACLVAFHTVTVYQGKPRRAGNALIRFWVITYKT